MVVPSSDSKTVEITREEQRNRKATLLGIERVIERQAEISALMERKGQGKRKAEA